MCDARCYSWMVLKPYTNLENADWNGKEGILFGQNPNLNQTCLRNPLLRCVEQPTYT
jgi:hypothetical protein